VREPLLQGGRIEPAAAHLGNVEGLFAQAGHDGLGLEAIGVIDAFGRAFMRLGVEKVGALDLARFIDQDAQRLAGAVQPVGQQRCKSSIQGGEVLRVVPWCRLLRGLGEECPEEIACGNGLPGLRRGVLPSSALRALRALIAAAGKTPQNQQATNLQKQCCTICPIELVMPDAVRWQRCRILWTLRLPV
jgi:hypothetical protein